jgi:MtrB/PioB family decaheme-associated outer membrane protein
VNFDVSHTNRTGAILYSGTFGFSNAVDIPQPIDQHTTNTSLSYEHQHGNVVLRAGFNGSYFRNDISTITWDNPYRFTDVATLSGQGRSSVAPSNNFNVLNGSISFKAPHHSRFTGYVAFGFLDDNGATVVPYTINSALTVLPLVRNTVGGEGRTKNANFTFTSRPNHTVSFDVRYKYYDYVNRTPDWTNTSRVQYDSSLQIGTPTAPLSAASAERFGGSRSTFSADLHIVAPGGGSIGAGFARNQATYDERFFTGSHENIAHVSFDALSTQYVSLHTKYEHAVRRGVDLDTTGMAAGGEQPTLRHYDIADRDRDLFTLVATVFPVNGVSLTATAGTGEDKYPTTNFGLTNAKHYVYSLGFDVDPNEHVNLNAAFTLDDFKSTQWSRTANPAPDPTYTNPARDWSDAAHDRTEAIQAGLGFLNLADNKVNVRFSYDYNRGRGFYIYGTGSAPLDPVVATVLAAPSQLPNLVSDLTRGTFDLTYAFTPKVAVGLTYWYEQFKVSDLALDAAALPAFNLNTTDILMGYQYLPYTSNSVFLRLTCHF